jgi:excisionase family DNA binding protein
MSNERLTLTVTEAAKLLGISRAMAYECVRTGDLPAIRLGGRILILELTRFGGQVGYAVMPSPLRS